MIAVAEKAASSIRRLIVGHPEEGYVRLLSRLVGRLGWQVHVAPTGTAARGLARKLTPSVVVLATRGTEESGWLTCAKLTREVPGQQVILVNNEPRPGCRRLSKFVGGAALVSQAAGVGVLVDHIQAAAQPQSS